MFEHIEQISNNLTQIKWALVSITLLFWIRAMPEFYKNLKDFYNKKKAEKKVIGFSFFKK